MMKRLLFLMLLVALNAANTQAQSIEEKLKAKYGWACEHTSDGKKWYSVKIDGKEGACDEKGKELLAPLFDDVRVHFEDSYIEAKKDKKVSIYSIKGKLIISTPYEEVKWWQMKDDPYCSVTLNGKQGLMDKNGKLVVPCEYDDFSTYEVEKTGICGVKQNGKEGAYDITNHKLLIPCQFDDISYYYLREKNYIGVELNGKSGLIDKNGKLVVPCEYSSINDFEIEENGWCVVGKGKGVDQKQGIFSLTDNKEIVSCKYDRIIAHSSFRVNRNVFVVIRDGFFGVCNKNGQEIIPCKYSYLDEPYKGNGKFFVATKGGNRPSDEAPARLSEPSRPKDASWGVVDLQGKEVVPFKYDYVWISGNVAVCDKGVIWKITPNRTVIDYYDNKRKYTSYNSDWERKDSLYAFYSLVTGKYTDSKYKAVRIGEGYISCVNQSGKWGYLDAETMEQAIPFEYEAAEPFKDGVAQVKKNGAATFITDPKRGTALKLANGGSSVKVDTNIPENATKKEESFAFIIANENYAHLKGADYAINDGKVFKEYCLKTFGMPERNVRYFEDATYGNIVNAVKKIKDIADVYEGDANIIVYFSGLGATDGSSKERYLLPTDATIATLKVTGFSVQKLMDELNALKTRQTIVILDAPFSGLDKEGKLLGESRGVAIAPRPATPQGNTIIITASSGNESAYSLKEYGHSLFTYALLDKIQESKGKCSVKEAVDHATSWTKKESLKRFNKTQSPQMQTSSLTADKMNNIKF